MNVLANQLPSFLGQQFGQQDVANITVNGSEFVNTILSSAGRTSPLMQGFVFLYRLLEQRFGLDPSLVLTTFGLAWGFTKMFSQFYTAIKGFVDSNLRCSITITENDTIYDHLMKWLSMQPAIKSDRYLMAQTVYPSAWENDEEDLMSGLSYTDGGDSEGQYEYLNFSNQAAKSTPRYVPAMGSTKFWHNGTYFRFTRKRESLVNSSGFSPMRETEEVSISCYGRSVVPLKRLIADAKATYFEDTHHRTTVYRPRAKEYRRDYNLWQQITSRPVRPMRTVVLNPKEKHEVLSDINEYLHPSTPRWYASRGIPLRRGYLFHGPPGTGKTSFSFALAGVFGIDIYVISLQDVNVTEEDLAALFAKLPRRCIVLLEDIDTAGLKRNEDESENKAKGETSEEKEDEKEATAGGPTEKKLTNGDTNTKEGKETGEADKRTKKKSKKSKRKSYKDSDDSDSESSSSSDDEAAKKKKKDKDKGKMRKKRIEKVPGRRGPGVATISMETISLSGLLNAIDGVASHEGRVLIMTTNKPESLDEALVRPGRVDLQVGFTNASKHQAMDLFVRMYEGVPPPRETRSVGKTLVDEKTVKPAEVWVGPAELKKIADDFSGILPEGRFSPAEIQGFLLKRKKSPRRALNDAPGWIEATMKQKDSKSKIMTVQ